MNYEKNAFYAFRCENSRLVHIKPVFLLRRTLFPVNEKSFWVILKFSSYHYHYNSTQQPLVANGYKSRGVVAKVTKIPKF